MATQPFVVPAIRDPDEPGNDISPMDLLRGFALGKLDYFPQLYQALMESKALFAITGIQKFFDVSGLGVGRVRSVSAIRFHAPLKASWISFLQTQQPVGVATVPIYAFSAIRDGSLRNRPEIVKVFVAQAAPDTLLLASTVELLQTALAKRAGGARLNAELIERAEWKTVNADAPVFAWRRYRTRPRFDEQPDPDALGVTYNASEDQSQTLTYLAPSTRSLSLLKAYWNDPKQGLSVETRRVSAETVRVEIRLTGSAAQVYFSLHLLQVLGFRIAI